MAAVERRIAILTAQKCAGKTAAARSVVEGVNCALLRNDSDVMELMFEEFGRGPNIERTLELWKKRHDPRQIDERLRQLHAESLSRISEQCILAEGWMYHLRRHRRSLLDAAHDLGYANSQFALVEFRLPEAVVIDRVIQARKERAGRDEFSNRPIRKQRGHAQKRIRDWESRFQPPDAEELQLLSDFRQFGSSEDAEVFLVSWFAAESSD